VDHVGRDRDSSAGESAKEGTVDSYPRLEEQPLLSGAPVRRGVEYWAIEARARPPLPLRQWEGGREREKERERGSFSVAAPSFRVPSLTLSRVPCYPTAPTPPSPMRRQRAGVTTQTRQYVISLPTPPARWAITLPVNSPSRRRWPRWLHRRRPRTLSHHHANSGPSRISASYMVSIDPVPRRCDWLTARGFARQCAADSRMRLPREAQGERVMLKMRRGRKRKRERERERKKRRGLERDTEIDSGSRGASERHNGPRENDGTVELFRNGPRTNGKRRAANIRQPLSSSDTSMVTRYSRVTYMWWCGT